MVGADAQPVDDDTDEPPARDGGQKADRWGKLLAAGVPTLLAGLIGVGGTIAGGYLQIHAAAQTQQAQTAEQRAEQARDKRADVYFAFLDAANKYSYTVENVRDCITEARDSRPPGATSYEVGPGCVTYINQLAPARQEFQAARNKVYVYGSDEAEQRARAIAAYLPNAVGGDPKSGLPPFDEDMFNFDGDVFNELYKLFQGTACREVPAEPRANCR